MKRPRNKKENDSLEAILRQLGCYDDERDEDRYQTLEMLEELLGKWSDSLLDGDNDGDRQHPRVSLVTFGSFHLGVHRPQSDLDVLALSPPHCTRTEFFASLVERMEQDEQITAIHSIPTAYTPVIK